jgi:hypothetical protein
MNKQMETQEDILALAIRAVAETTGLRLETTPARGPNATVCLEPGDRVFAVTTRRWAQHLNLGALLEQIGRLPQPALLVADYVNPRLAARLRDQDVQFIDAVGNAYVNQPPVYVYVTANRPERRALTAPIAGTNRAFEPKGLMVTYAFLCRPELLDAPYREIAQQADVAVGTVGEVLNGLKAAQLIRPKGGKRGYHLVNCRKLLNRWVDADPERLRPKLLLGEFVAEDRDWWKPIDIRDYGGYWGGEIAGARYTRYLVPAVATVYLPDQGLGRLLRDARLRRATPETGDRGVPVLIYRPFWPAAPPDTAKQATADLVHPVLAYADLVATAEPRNLEVARQLYDEYIAQYCGEA